MFAGCGLIDVAGNWKAYYILFEEEKEKEKNPAAIARHLCYNGSHKVIVHCTMYMYM